MATGFDAERSLAFQPPWKPEGQVLTDESREALRPDPRGRVRRDERLLPLTWSPGGTW